MIYECPHCHADNQDMFAGMGDNTILCMACDKEFREEHIIEKEGKRYIVSIALHEDGIVAGSKEDALHEVNRRIKHGAYSIMIVDEEDIHEQH